jgi:ElaB/YqjD/DUF883 family membrane-anchored ribosome-binding protein
MDNAETKTSIFWDFIRKRLGAEAALADWRLELGGEIDFEKLHHLYLAPTDRIAENIMCPKPCSPSCGFRKVCEWEGKYEAVCNEWPLKSYEIKKADAVFFTINPVNLLPAIAKAFKIIEHVKKFQNEEDTWTLGEVPAVGGKLVRVYLTLKAFSYEVMDLIYRINSKEQRPYILLVTSWILVRDTSEKILKDMGSAFVPLNEVLDFNADTELELLRECNLAQLVAPPTPEPEPEPANIFRKCGDAWVVKYDGGEKFMLTNCNTGAAYLHFMLARPNENTPIMEIIRKVSGESENVMSVDRLEDGILTGGYSFGGLPDSLADNIADDLALEQYKQEIDKIKHDIETAKSVGDNITTEQLEQDLQNLTSKINEIISPKGQKKNYSDQVNNIVTSFRNAVNYAIDKIAEHDEELAKHFKHSIKFGRTPKYFTEGNFTWHI